MRCAGPALFHQPVRRVRCAAPVRRCGQWVRRILFTISTGQVLIWRKHVAGCSLPLNNESQAIAYCLIPEMKQYVQYILKLIYCNPVDWQIYLLRPFVTMSDASGSHRACSHAAFCNGCSNYLLWNDTLIFKCYARSRARVTTSLCLLVERRWRGTPQWRCRLISDIGAEKNRCTCLCNSYIVLDFTIVCYCCSIIVLSSRPSCVLPSVRVIGKES